MFYSFEYVETEFLKEATNSDLLSEERAIAKAYFDEYTPKVLACICPACGEKVNHTETFMQIFGIEYYRCLKCASIFTPVDVASIAEFANYKPLVQFKWADRFQTVSQKRLAIWEDYLFWLNFRATRYLGGNTKFNLLDWDNPFIKFSEMIKHVSFCSAYKRGSTFEVNAIENTHLMDIAIYHDSLPSNGNPKETLLRINAQLKNNGLLVISTRVGSGFDVLTLKESHKNIFPYKYAFLPSVNGLEVLLRNCGFEPLEVSTPGSADVEYVLAHKEKVSDTFLQYLIQESDTFVLSEFQRFLQISGLSSYARIVARKV